MKKTVLIVASAMLSMPFMGVSAQTADENEKQLGFMLFGASFAIPQNGWFEIACENMGAEAINKAVSGEAIYNDARRMAAGTDYTTAELDRADILVLGHVHNQNVANTANLKDTWEEYTNIATTTDYAVAYDYVIKRYMADCAALEFNPDSKYYGVAGGKPVKIMLSTHWHDGRAEYNAAIRKLADKWGFPLIKFDENIGFSKEDNQDDKGQPSREYAHDTETLYNLKFGWHPKRGSNSPIQQRMAAIFTQTVADAYGYEFPFEVSIRPVSEVILQGEDANFAVTFRNGMFPYSFSSVVDEEGLEGKRHIMTLKEMEKSSLVTVDASHSSWGEKVPETSTASASVLVAEYCASPDYDSYVSQLSSSGNFDSEQVLQLKIGGNASRKTYISFQASELMPRDADKVVVRLFYKDYTLGYFNTESSRPMEGVEVIGIEGNTNVYSSNKINWGSSSSHIFEPIASKTEITTDMAGSWVSLDVTDWALSTLQSLEEKHGNQNTGHLTFRLFIENNNWNALMNFYSTEGASATGNAVGPQLLFAKEGVLAGIEKVKTDGRDLAVRGDVVFNSTGSPVCVYAVSGTCVLKSDSEQVELNDLPKGIYVVRAADKTLKIRK